MPQQVRRKISDITHPSYDSNIALWEKYRFVGEGGEEFLNKYLIKRDGEEGFEDRKKLTYIPAIAKSALTQIANSIRRQLPLVNRYGGSELYQKATAGKGFGVDRAGSSMNHFIGSNVVYELLMMGCVGVYIDAPNPKEVKGTPTVADADLFTPYMYVYPAEKIRAWTPDPRNLGQFTQLLLQDTIEVANNQYGLVDGVATRYRFYQKDVDSGVVTVQFFDEDGNPITSEGEKGEETITLDIGMIPFVIFKLNHSLLADISRHQISLLNLSSADMKYVWEGNIVFLAEQFDPEAPENFFRHRVAQQDAEGGTDRNAMTETSRRPEKLFIGTTKGVRVPKGIDYPQYVGPPTGPLEVSMLKQDRIKEEIHTIIHLNLITIQGHTAGASDVRRYEEQREEDGLRVVGEELESGENQIARIWEFYVNAGKEPALVQYPKTYEFKTLEDREKNAERLMKMMLAIPSETGRREVAKRIAVTLLSGYMQPEKLVDVLDEIDRFPGLISDPIQLSRIVDVGILSPATAAQMLGFDPGEAKKAEEARARRAAMIAAAQMAGKEESNPSPSGVAELSPNPDEQERTRKNNARDKGRKVRKDGPNVKLGGRN